MKKKQKGGDVLGASLDLIRSMRNLGNSIYIQIDAITDLSGDINRATAPVSGTPNVIEGPPKFEEPKL